MTDHVDQTGWLQTDLAGGLPTWSLDSEINKICTRWLKFLKWFITGVMFCRGNAGERGGTRGNAVPRLFSLERLSPWQKPSVGERRSPWQESNLGERRSSPHYFCCDCTSLTAKLVQPKNIYFLTMNVIHFWKLSMFPSKKYLRP